MSDRRRSKSQSTQLALALMLGPLGLLYSSLSGAVVLALGAAVLAKDFGPHGVLFVWPLAVITGFFTVRHWNRRAGAAHAHPAPGGSQTHAMQR